MRSRLLALLCLAVPLVAPTSARAGANFDAFFTGMDAACEVTQTFAAWRNGLAAKHVPGAVAAPLVRPPADVAAGIGPVTAIDAGDHVRMTVPLEGTYRGLKLTRVVFYFGKENGIFGWALEFAEEPARLKQVLGKAVEAGNAKMAKAEESTASTGFDLDNGRVALFCDFSN